jgi:lipid-A-disaccharide synthase
MQSAPKIFIIAGEASGDENGAELVDGLIKLNENISFTGIGGRKLKEKNVELIHNYSSINFIGFSNVIKNLSKIKQVLKDTVEYVKNLNPDLIVLIDFPGFNLKFAELVKKFYKGKIIYYISPQIWAWHKSRIERIKKYIDRMLVVFPFEVDFYKRLNYNVYYVGHPMYKRISKFLSENSKTDSYNLNITLLPGSRTEEIERIFPNMACAAEVIRSEFNADINLIYPEYINLNIYRNLLKGRHCNLIPNSENNHLKTLLNSDLVLTKFGTTTLELAFLNTPYISVYKAGIFNYSIAKMSADIKYVSMPNILLDKQIVKEFIQSEMTAENIFSEANRILTDKTYKNNMLEGFKETRNIFETTPVPKPAPEIIFEELNGK